MCVPQLCNVGRAVHRPSVHIVKKHVDRPVNGNFRPQRKTKHIGKRKPFSEKSSHEAKLSYSFSDTANKIQPQEQSRQKRRGSCALARDHESSYQKFGGSCALSQDPENSHRKLGGSCALARDLENSSQHIGVSCALTWDFENSWQKTGGGCTLFKYHGALKSIARKLAVAAT